MASIARSLIGYSNMVQWKYLRQPIHLRDKATESDDLRECFKYLDATSRSFSAVIQELHPELMVPVCLFYLILRGLDTIEDDMTIPVDVKGPHLLQFHEYLDDPAWTFQGSGPNEKDRELLKHFDVVTREYAKIKPEYRKVITRITKEMGHGMEKYLRDENHNKLGVQTINEYRQYCHYVAGIVGEGLTQLFVLAKLADDELVQVPALHESMGLFLQQVNITRDIHEDYEDSRLFWPKEVWSKYVSEFGDLFKPENLEVALECGSNMVLVALEEAENCLYYLSKVRDQSVFNFTAIPQAMAIATLALVFRNPAVFKRNVKITKGEACELMFASTADHGKLCQVFRKYARVISLKNDPADRNHVAISLACAKIEGYIDKLYPPQLPGGLRSEYYSKGGLSKGSGHSQGVLLSSFERFPLKGLSWLALAVSFLGVYGRHDDDYYWLYFGGFVCFVFSLLIFGV